MDANTAPSQIEILNLLKLVRPWTMTGSSKVRIGNDYDGGYVLPAQVLHCDAIVSVGVGPDVSFDLVLAERGAKVLQYDHTVEGLPQQHPNFIFHKRGWGARTEGDFLSFDDIFAHLQALKPKRAMLKFDIEGGEYEVLEAIKPEHLAFFDVVACEFHGFEKLHDRRFYEGAKRAFEKLSAQHVPVHLHANNALGVVLVQGIPIPLLLEVAYLRHDLDHFPSFSHDPIPGPFDRPNIPGRVDLCINPF
ncbi:FkbM family methyltransferase [Caldimonas brevitalea]|uniref:Uncharacterized protein n=1 Tax=Caldimonas brevitalea TaxID=413882 RepID=A0A0G3BGR7_9BURK|nr:FkbM family methyltransferase [Caldimonas brevitalea]AKJ28527.1 hypothetical protein AAW51_1836 [Caldimonas brevitalea]